MQLLPPAEPQYTIHTPEWREAVRRLRSGRAANPLYATLLTPLVDRFEAAWTQLRQLAVVAESFAPPPDGPRMPIQFLAEFILDEVVDAFRGSASELVLLIPTGDRWLEASPSDVLEEAGRFQRLLTVAAMAAGHDGTGNLLAETTLRVAAGFDRWYDDLAPPLTAITELLESLHYGTGDAFGAEPDPRDPN
jgi:hypothetical protein